MHLLGAAAARPLLALRELVSVRWKNWARYSPWCWTIWGDKQGQNESEPIRVRAGRLARRIGGDGNVASWPSRSGQGRWAPPERRERDAKCTKDVP